MGGGSYASLKAELNMGDVSPINPLGQESELSFPREFNRVPITKSKKQHEY